MASYLYSYSTAWFLFIHPLLLLGFSSPHDHILCSHNLTYIHFKQLEEGYSTNMYMIPSCFALFTLTLLTTPSTSSDDYSFIFYGCSQVKYMPGYVIENNVNSVLTSIVNSATMTNYNKFTVSGSTPQDTVYGLYQCAGNFQADQCAACVALAVSQLGNMCPSACGGALQLDGCFVKYDNATFLGADDRTLIVRKCGPSIGYNSNALTRRDAVLAYLGSSDSANKKYGLNNAGDVSGVAQCTGDLSQSKCQDCLTDAIGRLRMDCGEASFGDVFLSKCYARYSIGGAHSSGAPKDDNHNDNEIEKTLAILLGLVAGVALMIVFISAFSQLCEKRKDGK